MVLLVHYCANTTWVSSEHCKTEKQKKKRKKKFTASDPDNIELPKGFPYSGIQFNMAD